MINLKKLAEKIANLSLLEAKELDSIIEHTLECGPALSKEESIKLSHFKLYENTQGSSIAILTAHKNSANDEDNIKANSHLYSECRKTGYQVYKIETYADFDRANKLFTRENHVNVSNSPYILKGIAQLVIGVKSKKFITSSTDAFKQEMIGIAYKFEQDSIIFKPSPDENAYLIGTNDSANVGMNQLLNLGKWHPSKFGEMFSKLKNGHSSEPLNEKEEYAFLRLNSFFSRGNNPIQ